MEELANDAAACGSECGAHSEFLGAGSGSGEEEIREVDADDEEDESDGAPEDDERAAKTSGDVLLEVGDECGVAALIPAFDAVVQGRDDEVGLGLGGGDGDTGLEAAGEGDHVAPLAELVVEVRGEDVHLCAGRVDGAEVEAFGQDADDGVGRGAEGDDLPMMLGSPLRSRFQKG